MSSQYTDANVSLKDLALTQFELARDIPAAIELMSPNPQTLDIQVRMLLLKINAALSNFKLSRLTVGIGIKDLSFFSPILHFLHGDKDTRLKIFSYDPSAWTKKSPVVNEVLEKLNRDQFLNSETEITHSVIKDDGFGILLLPSVAVNEAGDVAGNLSNQFYYTDCGEICVEVSFSLYRESYNIDSNDFTEFSEKLFEAIRSTVAGGDGSLEFLSDYKI